MSLNLRAGFTFVEVVCCLLVLSLGIAAAVGMAVYAMMLGSRAQGQATGMSTALSVAIDPAPLLSPSNTTWQTPGNTGIGRTSGWINGFYVVRVETAGTTIAGNGAAPLVMSDPVSVDVFDGFQGHMVASYSTRIIKQAASP